MSPSVFHKLFVTVILHLVLAGCASLSSISNSDDNQQQDQVLVGSQAESIALPAAKGWWYARFHIPRPAGEATRWYMGSLLGGEVIVPVFVAHYQDVHIWRIHRRAAYDTLGHVFSFIFYSTPQAAKRIYHSIENHVLVQNLLQNGRLTKVAFDDVSRITRPNIEDTSDDHWPLSVQRTWPSMIMGISRMWLDLVSELASRETDDSDIEAKYRNVQNKITLIWREQGQHAMLHHLNAVYAYQPLLIRY